MKSAICFAVSRLGPRIGLVALVAAVSKSWIPASATAMCVRESVIGLRSARRSDGPSRTVAARASPRPSRISATWASTRCFSVEVLVEQLLLVRAERSEHVQLAAGVDDRGRVQVARDRAHELRVAGVDVRLGRGLVQQRARLVEAAVCVFRAIAFELLRLALARRASCFFAVATRPLRGARGRAAPPASSAFACCIVCRSWSPQSVGSANAGIAGGGAGNRGRGRRSRRRNRRGRR